MDRIAQLTNFIAAQPDEPFPRYALALELKNRGDLPKASDVLEDLLQRKPDYLAAYLQLGLLLQSQGRKDRAAEVLRRGQAVAQQRGDQHTLSELTAALDAC